MKSMRQLGFFSLGVEEEFQIVDPKTRELRSHIEEVLEAGQLVLKESVRAEMHKSTVETGTGICEDIGQVRKELTHLRSELSKVAQAQGLTIGAAGTHPFSHWIDQEITDHSRYEMLIEELQNVARKNLIFGLHVHVGFPDRENAIPVINAASYFLPHLLALSANSPFWLGEDTGFCSYRVKVFESFPRTGIPHHFHSLSAYEDYVKLLVKTNCIDNPKKIWWDLRLHPFFDTIEFRVCDVQMTVEETLGLAALIQALTAKLYKLVRSNLTFRTYRRCYVDENRFRAARHGINGRLIDFGKQEEVETKSLTYELLDFVDDVVDELGSRNEIKLVEEVLKRGTGADRQRKVYEETKDLKKVVDFIISETHQGLKVSGK